MTRIETLKLMGYSEAEAIERATAETTARLAFKRTKVTVTPNRITVDRNIGNDKPVTIITPDQRPIYKIPAPSG